MKIRKICMTAIFALLSLMVLVGCQMEAPPVETLSPTEAPIQKSIEVQPELNPVTGETVYSVSTVDELLSAIGPDRVIELAPGLYDLSQAIGYGTGSTEYWYWQESYDGYELVINGVNNLRLSGGTEKTEIVTAPRYADVLSFEYCEDIGLEYLTLGHSPEPGVCAGGVVYLDKCSEVWVDNCGLYGCGIIGIQAYNSRGIHASNSLIYDCSQNAVYTSACHDVLLENCKVYNNGVDWSQSMFYAEGCTGFALVNCEIYENFSDTLLTSSYSRQVSVLGCEIRDNSFESFLFRSTGYSPVVDKCSFSSNGEAMSFGEMAVLDINGEELSNEALESMQHGVAEYEGPLEASGVELDESVNEEGLREVSVRTVDEFLAAIGNDTVIKLEAELFDLSCATDYGAYGNEYYYWSNVFDGPALVISGVQNLSIVAEEDCTIAAVPRYANVINFLNCEDISLSGFTAGHTLEPGECAGGVLSFENCWDVAIDDCRLFGCGILGIQAWCCSELEVKNTEIYDCSIGAIALYTVMDASFENMDVHDCAAPEIYLTDSMGVFYEGIELKSGDYALPIEK